MTWTDAHGVVHLVHKLPDAVWEQYQNRNELLYGGVQSLHMIEIKDGDVTIIGPAVAAKVLEFPKYQTYCGLPRREAGDAPGAPTCVECANTHSLVARLPEDYPWWR